MVMPTIYVPVHVCSSYEDQETIAKYVVYFRHLDNNEVLSL